ncbi:hypothetical protein BB561_003022 [Smittium simulii]|uniref:Small ribosomal subunit protein mS23 n=1 Tax=Smittium simulii TaxID=133385 RepID=A0A2T9YNA4_9FUNG|nr:hypothetical protein BB561_003022 [Smittium simulii]
MGRSKNTARNVYHTFNRLLKGKLRETRPVWHIGMEFSPPNSSIFCNMPKNDTSGKIDFEKASEIPEKFKQINNFTVPPRSSNRKIKSKATISTPPKIEYPEDKLRRRFFEDHPAEAINPIILAENQCTDHTWDSINNSRTGINPESVIRYQWYLINQGLDEEAAYKKATDEYYRAKGRIELEKKISTIEALQYGAYPIEKIHSKLTLQFEEKQLRIKNHLLQP